MKLRTEKGCWKIEHNGKAIKYENALQSMCYCLTMGEFETHIAPPHCVYPVKSLVPHPKKRRMTKKWREKIEKIKINYKLGVNAE